MTNLDNKQFKKRIGKVFTELQELEKELMGKMRIEYSDKPHPNLAQNHIDGLFSGLKQLNNVIKAA